MLNLTWLNVDFVLSCMFNGCGFDAFENEFDLYNTFRNWDVIWEWQVMFVGIGTCENFILC
jgi:hypothetical protein